MTKKLLTNARISQIFFPDLLMENWNWEKAKPNSKSTGKYIKTHAQAEIINRSFQSLFTEGNFGGMSEATSNAVLEKN